MAQQTAVDLIISQFKKQKDILKNHFEAGKWNDDRVSEIENCILICENTKQIEKEQLCDALDFGKVCMLQSNYKSAEQYYKETFGNE